MPKKDETAFHGAGYWFGDISETFHAQVFNVGIFEVAIRFLYPEQASISCKVHDLFQE